MLSMLHILHLLSSKYILHRDAILIMSCLQLLTQEIPLLAVVTVLHIFHLTYFSKSSNTTPILGWLYFVMTNTKINPTRQFLLVIELTTFLPLVVFAMTKTVFTYMTPILTSPSVVWKHPLTHLLWNLTVHHEFFQRWEYSWHWCLLKRVCWRDVITCNCNTKSTLYSLSSSS